MALSNWDTLAFNTEGKPCNGVLSTQLHEDGHASVEIYKNWIYVRDTKMWSDESRYVEPVIAEIQEGEVRLSMFEIHAKRTDSQNAVLMYAKTGYHANDNFQCMCGIGCYGYAMDSDEWVGVEQGTLQELFSFLRLLKDDHVLDKEYIEKVMSATPLRFNQGDAYIMKELGLPDSSATEVGKSEVPVILQMLKDGK